MKLFALLRDVGYERCLTGSVMHYVHMKTPVWVSVWVKTEGGFLVDVLMGTGKSRNRVLFSFLVPAEGTVAEKHVRRLKHAMIAAGITTRRV